MDFAKLRGAGLAPMAGVSDAATRLLCYEKGAKWAVSEMLSAKGWIYSRGMNKNALDIIARLPGEGIAGLQLFGREPEYMARAAADLERAGFEFFDINMGCPARKIAGAGEGAALMREPALVGEIVSAVVYATNLRVSVKIRSGWDSDNVNAVKIAEICEKHGAGAITVHARTREQQYSGKADWRVIADVKRAVGIPVFGNGDIFSSGDALEMLEQTGCDAVMVGRGAQGDPWIFERINAALTGDCAPPPQLEARFNMIRRHFALEIELHGKRRALPEMRKHIAWYINGLRGAAKFREAVNHANDIETVMAMLDDYLIFLRNCSQ